MKHVICFSKGIQSALVAIEVVRKFGPENVILLNHDINSKKEQPDVKRFGLEVASYLRIPITYANMPGWDTKSQFDVCIEARAFKVGDGKPLCTNRLKTEPFYEWLSTNFPVKKGELRDDLTIYYGFSPEEPDRIRRRRKHLDAMGYKSEYPLAEWSRTIRTTLEVGIKPPETYEIWSHANCIGCLRAGWQHWYVVYCLFPEVWEEAKAAEAQISYSILRRDNKPQFLRERETEFERMKQLGVPASEKIPPGRFWSLAKKVVAGKVHPTAVEWIPLYQMDLLESYACVL